MRLIKKPPLLTVWLFKPMMPREDRAFLLDNFEEMYENVALTEGHWRAMLWSWRQCIGSTPHFLKDQWYWSSAMLKNLMKIAFRNLARQRLNSLLNILGLAIGLAAAWVLIFHVNFELSFDSWNPQADDICRIAIKSRYGDTYRDWTRGPVMLSPMLTEQLPEIESYARMRRFGDAVISRTVSQGRPVQFYETGGYWADGGFSSYFNLTYLEGDSASAFANPNSIILTESMARKYFGDRHALGQDMAVEGGRFTMTVSAVVRDLPPNSFLSFDYLIPMTQFIQLLQRNNGEPLNSRTWKAVTHFVKMRPGFDQTAVETKMADFQKAYHADIPNRDEVFTLQPVKQIHLHSHLEDDPARTSDIMYVYIFGSVAMLILILAGVNFVNISMAQAMKRMKEVGLRKVLGAQRQQLVKQFMGETYLLISCSVLLAVLLILFMLPLYNSITGFDFTLNDFLGGSTLTAVAVSVLLLGLLAGAYPAWYLSRFQPAEAVKTGIAPRSSAARLRSALVIFQFVISVFMIFGAVTIQQQLRFFKHSQLGFDKSSLLGVRLHGDQRQAALQNREALRNELKSQGGIIDVGICSNLPGQRLSIEHLRPQGVEQNEDVPSVRVMRGDQDFLQTLGVTLAEGRHFLTSQQESRQFILNETAVSMLGFNDAVGKPVVGYGGEGFIVGVMKNFHFESLKNELEPLVLEYDENAVNYLLLRYKSSDEKAVLKHVQATLDKFAPNQIFNYEFIEDHLNLLYLQEERLADLFQFFSGLAILISCLGLFGIAAYSAQLRVKEIGVRKVLGASALNVMLHLIKRYVLWVALANLLALPLAWWAMSRWLQAFAYQAQIGVLTFLLAGTVSLAVALLTVAYRSLKASLSNPVRALRYE